MTLAVQLKEDLKEKNCTKDTTDVVACYYVCQKSCFRTVQDISNQICRWEKQVFIYWEIVTWILETNIQNP